MADWIVVAAFALLAIVTLLVTLWGVYHYQRAERCERERRKP
jgi:hypothetical protein